MLLYLYVDDFYVEVLKASLIRLDAVKFVHVEKFLVLNATLVSDVLF